MMELKYKVQYYNSNDQRSNSMNSNSPAYWASVENRTNQLNPNNEEYKGDSEEED